MNDLISRQAAIDEWKNDFKGYVNALDIPRDDYNGIMAYIDEVPSAQPNLQPTCNNLATDTISRQAAIDAADRADYRGLTVEDVKKITDEVVKELKQLPSAQPDVPDTNVGDTISRRFVELLAEYHDPEICPYKEYKGKPYFSIKYIENGEEYIGYGTYNPKVLSQYLREYFMVSAQPEPDNHAVACLLAELFDDTCACNFCDIDEWLPEKCEFIDSCPNPGGVTCWEQFLKHRAERKTDELGDS